MHDNIMPPLLLLREEHARFTLTEDDQSRRLPWKVQAIERVTVNDLVSIGVRDLIHVGFGNWDGILMLLPLWAVGLVAAGEQLISIDGEVATVGRDYIDTDTRGGFIAYGFEHPGLKELKNAAA